MFADYRVPQILVHLGVLVYTDALAAKIAAEEVRGCPCARICVGVYASRGWHVFGRGGVPPSTRASS